MMMTNLCPARLSSHWWQNIASKSRSRLSCFLIIVTYQSLWITNKINAFVLEHVCYNVNLQWAVTKQKKDKPNVEFQHISPSDWRDEDDGEPLIDFLSDWRLACQLRVSWLTTHQVQRLDSALPLWLPRICTCNVHTLMLSISRQTLKIESFWADNFILQNHLGFSKPIDWKDVGELHPSPHVVAVVANLLARLLINTDSTDPDSDSSCRDCCRILNHCSFQAHTNWIN